PNNPLLTGVFRPSRSARGRSTPSSSPTCGGRLLLSPPIVAMALPDPVVAAWDRLPEAVRAGIVAMVQAASGCDTSKKQRTWPSGGALEVVGALGDRLDRLPGLGLGTPRGPDDGGQDQPQPNHQGAEVLADERTDSLPPPAVRDFPSTSGWEVRDGRLAIDHGQTRQAVDADRHHEDAPEEHHGVEWHLVPEFGPGPGVQAPEGDRGDRDLGDQAGVREDLVGHREAAEQAGGDDGADDVAEPPVVVGVALGRHGPPPGSLFAPGTGRFT